MGTALGVSIVYGIYTVTKEGGRPFNQAENIIYGTFSRFVWGLALAWVIYACHKGYGSKRAPKYNSFWTNLHVYLKSSKSLQRKYTV